ncbi:FGGY-family carbohydrate kinase [Pleomorphomonas sp. JP5]|uniref:FGGY-family carbohydrate kinase n=1 Tax=Pleomorphomonas sp. JP5 TaxID=2942998 RepID=UPI0020447CF5|nr:FGGY-family carbohydrate kinase [Pleomorphomonas sp. JP5]MCM5558169.1 FGGY-family carbohydrate kinase [Pleomorphomonas sp. JP5]
MAYGVIAVDVGSHQVRAGLFDLAGTLVEHARRDISLGQHSNAMATYQMEEIWAAVCCTVAHCGAQARAHDLTVTGLAFDATSSLYVDNDGKPIAEGQGDVFGWMDHRAQREAAEINATGHPYLQYFGGTISPEIHLPKIVWYERHRSGDLDDHVQFRDVCDELARRATAVDARSKSALVCKWPFVPSQDDTWCADLLDTLGLGGRAGLGSPADIARGLASALGGVSKEASRQLGLPEGVVVGTGAIDAEAGVLGNVGADLDAVVGRTLLMTGGTSTNFMAFSTDSRFIDGVWGPFRDAVFPGYWMHEGGQSFSGGALDAVLKQHPASPGEPTADNHRRAAADVLALLAEEGRSFAAQKHLVPDWLGNRAPLNDSRVRTIMTGLGQELDYRSFLESYYATARGLALQMRQVIEHLNAHGYAIDKVHLSGGHRHNPLLVRLYADCFEGALHLCEAPEPVLAGTAMMAAVAAGHYPTLRAAAARMSTKTRLVERDADRVAQLEADYDVYLRLYEVRNEIFRAGLPTP